VAQSKKISIFAFAKFQAILTTLLGTLCGVLYSFGGLIIDTLVTTGFLSTESMSTPGLSFGTVLAFGALIVMPIIFAVFGFLAGIIEAIFYNLFARWIRGIDLDFNKK